MSRSGGLVESADAFSPLEREKTIVMEELIFARSDDIAKLDVDEILLRDFEELYQRTPVHSRKVGSSSSSSGRFSSGRAANPYVYPAASSTRHRQQQCDDPATSKNNPQALTQMFAASRRGHRIRRYPAQLQQQTSAGAADGDHDHDQDVQQQRRRPMRPTPRQLRRVLRPPPPPSPPPVATPPTAAAADDDDNSTRLLQQQLEEAELTSLTDRLVAESLSRAVTGNAIHREASRIVRSALRRAEERLDGMR